MRNPLFDRVSEIFEQKSEPCLSERIIFKKLLSGRNFLKILMSTKDVRTGRRPTSFARNVAEAGMAGKYFQRSS